MFFSDIQLFITYQLLAIIRKYFLNNFAKIKKYRPITGIENCILPSLLDLDPWFFKSTSNTISQKRPQNSFVASIKEREEVREWVVDDVTASRNEASEFVWAETICYWLKEQVEQILTL